MQYIKNIPQIFKNINKYTSGIHYYSKEKTALMKWNMEQYLIQFFLYNGIYDNFAGPTSTNKSL
jgi:hypothetical protein